MSSLIWDDDGRNEQMNSCDVDWWAAKWNGKDGQDDGDLESEGGELIRSDQQIDDLGKEICVSVGSAEGGDEGWMPPPFTYIWNCSICFLITDY